MTLAQRLRSKRASVRFEAKKQDALHEELRREVLEDRAQERAGSVEISASSTEDTRQWVDARPWYARGAFA